MCVFWREWYIGDRQVWRVLRISCSFYYLVASTACFVHIMKIQVLAEREQKIQTEVKEIRKVFYCDLCNKQYKLAMEFEAHLSSYDHNHRKVNGLFWPVTLTVGTQFCCLWHTCQFCLIWNTLNEIFSVLKKWEKCMALAVGMIGKNGSSNVRRRRWLSLLKCIHSHTLSTSYIY